MRARVVITGIGLVTSLGHGLEVWERLLAGASGISKVGSFDTQRYRVDCGGEVKEFRPDRWIRCLKPANLGRASQFAIAAASGALRDGGFEDPRELGERWGVCIGTTSGEPQEIETYDDQRLISPAGIPDSPGRLLSRYCCHLIAANVAAEFGVLGDVSVCPAACAAGNYAIAHGVDVLQSGRRDWMLAGGADCFSRITYTGFARLGAIARERCQPFDLNRQGMIPGEGAAVLLLERLDTARARRARIYAEFAGYGITCDAHHMTAAHPDATGAIRAMQLALTDARMSESDISYISAHGTGTKINDRLETLALKRLFNAAKLPPVSSVKSMLGHTMGAASAIEAAVCALSIATDHVPPTTNYCDPDPECDLDCVPNVYRAIPVTAAMNNAFGFGGINSSLILHKCVI